MLFRLKCFTILLMLLNFVGPLQAAPPSDTDTCDQALEYGKVGDFNNAERTLLLAEDNGIECDFSVGSVYVLRDLEAGKVNAEAVTHFFYYWQHEKNDRFAEMVAEGEKAVRASPGYGPAYGIRGSGYGLLGEFDRAITDYDRAIALEPGNAITYNGRGHAKKASGDLDGALSDFEYAIDHGYEEAYIGRGAIYMMKGDYKKAVADAEHAVKTNPEMAETWSMRGLLYEMNGRHAEAKKDVTKALEIDPDNPEAWLTKFAIHDMNGEKPQTIEAIHKFIELAPPMASKQVEYVRKRLRDLEN